jgi:hypothetical protein
MAEEMQPDFTFDQAGDPDPWALKPLYRAILAPGPVPTVSLGPVTRAVAVEWLRRQQARYAAGLGDRSGLIKKMDLAARVELVGLAPDAP